MQFVLNDQPGIAIQAAIEVEVKVRQWLWAGDGIVAIVEAHRDDIFLAWMGELRDVHNIRQIPAHELTGGRAIDPNFGRIHCALEPENYFLVASGERQVE